jgi:hypothetical protein
VPCCHGKLGLLKDQIRVREGTSEVKATATRPKITVTADGRGAVSHAGSRLLADLADRPTLTSELSEGLSALR